MRRNGKTSSERLISQFGLYQIIEQPTRKVDSSSSCIDLVFSSQPNLFLESGVQSELLPNCHREINCAKFDITIYCIPPYEMVVCQL